MVRRIVALLAVVTALFLLDPAATAQAQESAGRGDVVSLSLPVLAEDLPHIIQGYKSVFSFEFTLPTGWEPAGDAQLVLDYRISALNLVGATVTVRANDQNARSVAVTDETGRLSIPIPAESLKPGQNTVDILPFLPLAEDQDCVVPDHPARWLQLEPASRLHLDLSPQAGSLSMADFPAAFESVSQDKTTITFVIPEDANDHELQALATIAFALEQKSVTDPAWVVASADEFQPQSVAGPVILIGTQERNTFVASLALTATDRPGLIGLKRPAWAGGHPVLAVTALEDEVLPKVALALTRPVIRETTTESLSPASTAIADGEATLAELGYGEKTVYGPGERSLIYAFDLPFDWATQNSLFDLHFVHAANIDPDVATLEIFVNGLRTGSIRMNAPESTGNDVPITLPKSQLRPGRNYIRLTFDFGDPIYRCDRTVGNEPWASVRPESSFEFSFAESGGRMDLNDYPFHLMAEEDLNDLTVVLPDDPESTDILNALQIIRELGASDSHLAPHLALASSVTAKERQRHLVILGTPAQQPLLRDLNNYMPLSFDLEAGTVRDVKGIYTPPHESSLGMVQSVRSPWGRNRLILVVSGTTPDGYQRAASLMNDPDLRPLLDTQLVLVSGGVAGEPLHVYTQIIPDVDRIPGIGFLDRLFYQTGADRYPALPMVMVTVALLLLGVLSWSGLRHSGTPR